MHHRNPIINPLNSVLTDPFDLCFLPDPFYVWNHPFDIWDHPLSVYIDIAVYASIALTDPTLHRMAHTH